MFLVYRNNFLVAFDLVAMLNFYSSGKSSNSLQCIMFDIGLCFIYLFFFMCWKIILFFYSFFLYFFFFFSLIENYLISIHVFPILNPPPSSPPHTIPLGCPSAPAPGLCFRYHFYSHFTNSLLSFMRRKFSKWSFYIHRDDCMVFPFYSLRVMTLTDIVWIHICVCVCVCVCLLSQPCIPGIKLSLVMKYYLF